MRQLCWQLIKRWGLSHRWGKPMTGELFPCTVLNLLPFSARSMMGAPFYNTDQNLHDVLSAASPAMTTGVPCSVLMACLASSKFRINLQHLHEVSQVFPCWPSSCVPMAHSRLVSAGHSATLASHPNRTWRPLSKAPP